MANSSDDQNILDKESVAFWLTLNTCNFFFENVTEAIICGCLLFSGYRDVFLTMFAIPTILNTSVRLFKVLAPLLIYTVCPFLWNCLVACIDFIYYCIRTTIVFIWNCILTTIEYISSCFSFLLSTRRKARESSGASATELQQLEVSKI